MERRSVRDRYLSALRREERSEGEGLIWAPNFDYWLKVNRARGSLPERYRTMSRNDIVRAVDAAIWNRAGATVRTLDASVKETWTDLPDGSTRHAYQTPIGEIWEMYSPTEDAFSSKALTRHFVADLDALRVMRYVVEASEYRVDFAQTHRALDETGADGVVLNNEFCVPFIQFAKTDAGYVNGFYLWADHPEAVDGLVDVYFEKYVDLCGKLAAGPADIVGINDNMDELTMPPKLFERYAIPFYQACKDQLAASGKLLEAHWCGRTPHLLPMVSKTGLDVVEAVVTRPMADIELSRALDLLDGQVAFQGGIPSIYMSPAAAGHDAFERYIEETILPLSNRRGFVLGMSDNVPPDADFSRVEAVAGLIGARRRAV